MTNHRWGFRDGIDLVGKTLTRKSNGEHGLRIQVPGRSFLSICLVLVLRRHTLRNSGSRLCEEGYVPCASAAIPGVPSLIAAQFWRGRRFFISSVVDSVLNVARLWSSLCFGIGCGRLEWIFLYFLPYYDYIIVIFVILLHVIFAIWLLR